MDDLRKIVYGLLAVFLVGVLVWIGFLFFVSCDGSLDCEKRDLAVVRTPIPTLIPATLPAAGGVGEFVSASAPKCQVTAVDLLAVWIEAGYPENEPVVFTDARGRECSALFTTDIQPLFVESNLWYSGALACTTCHNASLSDTSAQMDLGSYNGILAGSRRPSADESGNDILGGGDWKGSKLYEVLIARQGEPLAMPLGRSVDYDATATIVFAGIEIDNPSE
ncbi:MAG: hypothetical protein JXA13_02670 [Anaerolineales bacterium]|nr:hypothetical protein [Anaerolineales bacterium]